MNNFIRENAVLMTIYMLLLMIMIGRLEYMDIIDLAYDITVVFGIICYNIESAKE